MESPRVNMGSISRSHRGSKRGIEAEQNGLIQADVCLIKKRNLPQTGLRVLADCLCNYKSASVLPHLLHSSAGKTEAVLTQYRQDYPLISERIQEKNNKAQVQPQSQLVAGIYKDKNLTRMKSEKRPLTCRDSGHTTWARKQKINMSGVGGSLRCSQTQIGLLHTVVIPTEKLMKSLSLSADTTRVTIIQRPSGRKTLQFELNMFVLYSDCAG